MLLPELATLRSAARRAMDEETVDRLWAAGRAMSADEAIAYAIGEQQ